MKKCSRCKELKSLFEFNKNITTKDGLQTTCIRCASELTKLYRLKNRKIKDTVEKLDRKEKLTKLNLDFPEKSKEKESLRQKIYQDEVRANPERCKSSRDKMLNYNLKKLYGITRGDYDTMLENQNGRCSICNEHGSKFKKSLCVDHCHKTGKVRSLLCSKCNTALGLLNEEVQLVDRLRQYIEFHKSQSIEIIIKEKTLDKNENCGIIDEE